MNALLRFLLGVFPTEDQLDAIDEYLRTEAARTSCEHDGTSTGRSRLAHGHLICQVICEQCGAVLRTTEEITYTPERKDSGT